MAIVTRNDRDKLYRPMNLLSSYYPRILTKLRQRTVRSTHVIMNTKFIGNYREELETVFNRTQTPTNEELLALEERKVSMELDTFLGVPLWIRLENRKMCLLSSGNKRITEINARFEQAMSKRFLRINGHETTNYKKVVYGYKFIPGTYVREFPVVPINMDHTFLRTDVPSVNIVLNILHELVNIGYFNYYITHGRDKFAKVFRKFMDTGFIRNPYKNNLIRVLPVGQQRVMRKYLFKIFPQLHKYVDIVEEQGLDEIVGTCVATASIVGAVLDPTLIPTGMVCCSIFITGLMIQKKLTTCIDTNITSTKTQIATSMNHTNETIANMGLPNILESVKKRIVETYETVKTWVSQHLSPEFVKLTACLALGFLLVKLMTSGFMSYDSIRDCLAIMTGQDIGDIVEPEADTKAVAAAATGSTIAIICGLVYFGMDAQSAARTWRSVHGIFRDIYDVVDFNRFKKFLNALSKEVLNCEPFTVDTLDEDLEEWIGKVLIILEKGDDGMRRDYDLLNQARYLYAEYKEKFHSSRNSLPRAKSLEIIKYSEQLRALLCGKNNMRDPSKMRQRPINIRLYGRVGQGKSLLVNALSKFITELDGPTMKYDPAIHRYDKSFTTEWWEKYNGEPVVVIDEFMAGTDKTDNAKILTTLNNCMETMPVVVPTAFSDKGTLHFVSRAIILTTNENGDMVHSGMIAPEAFFKRLDVNIEVVIADRLEDGVTPTIESIDKCFKFTSMANKGFRYAKANTPITFVEILKHIKAIHAKNSKISDTLEAKVNHMDFTEIHNADAVDIEVPLSTVEMGAPNEVPPPPPSGNSRRPANGNTAAARAKANAQAKAKNTPKSSANKGKDMVKKSNGKKAEKQTNTWTFAPKEPYGILDDKVIRMVNGYEATYSYDALFRSQYVTYIVDGKEVTQFQPIGTKTKYCVHVFSKTEHASIEMGVLDLPEFDYAHYYVGGANVYYNCESLYGYGNPFGSPTATAVVKMLAKFCMQVAVIRVMFRLAYAGLSGLAQVVGIQFGQPKEEQHSKDPVEEHSNYAKRAPIFKSLDKRAGKRRLTCSKCEKEYAAAHNVASYCAQCNHIEPHGKVQNNTQVERKIVSQLRRTQIMRRTVDGDILTQSDFSLWVNSTTAFIAAHSINHDDVYEIRISDTFGSLIKQIPVGAFSLHVNDKDHTGVIALDQRYSLPSIRDITKFLPDKPRRQTIDTVKRIVVRTKNDTCEEYHDEYIDVEVVLDRSWISTSSGPFDLSCGIIVHSNATRPGDCGNPYISWDMPETPLGWIHVGCVGKQFSLATAISKAHLAQLETPRAVEAQGMIDIGGKPASYYPDKTHPQGQIKHYFSLDPKHVHSPSPLRVNYDDGLLPCETHIPFQGVEGAKPFAESMRFHHHNDPGVPIEIMNWMEENIDTLVDGFLPTIKYEMWPIEDAIFGKENIPPLDPSTSIGPTYQMLDLGKSRDDFFRVSDKFISEQLKKDVSRKMKVLLQGQFERPVVRVMLKADEVLPLRKKTLRPVYNWDLADHVVHRMLFGCILNANSKRVPLGMDCVGINPTGLDWDVLAKELLAKEVFNGSDVTKLDVSTKGYMAYLLYIAIRRKYRIKYKSPLDNALYNVIMSSGVPYLVFGHTVTIPEWVLASGYFLTCFFNEFNVLLIHAVAFHFCMAEHFVVGSFNFRKLVTYKGYGDDVIKGTSRRVAEYYTCEKIAEIALDLFGIIITGEDKKDAGHWVSNLSDVTFLSRHFKYHHGNYEAPLVLTSFVKMLHWLAESKIETPTMVLTSIYRTASLEALFHGRSFYEKFIDMYAHRFEELGITWAPGTYDQERIKYERRKMGDCDVIFAPKVAKALVEEL